MRDRLIQRRLRLVFRGVQAVCARIQGVRACIALAAAQKLPLDAMWYTGLLKALQGRRQSLMRGGRNPLDYAFTWQCQQVLEDMKAAGVSPNASVYGVFVTIYANKGDFARAQVRVVSSSYA